jgi:tetratricopeptide (TPR) repeat protein
VKTRAERRGSDARYFLRFAGTAALLVAGTLVLVLYVLPQRYVLSSGFREGNLSFPNPSTPFEPSAATRVAALPPLPPAPPADSAGSAVSTTEPAAGPAELFWERVLPLLEQRRFAEALPLFEAYLADFPGDVGVRREHGITLAAAGQREEGLIVLRALLEHEDDAELHLLLARLLRDLRRVDEADTHYAAALERAGDDPALVLEWARAHASVQAYADAERILRSGLERHPESVPLLVELARLHYWTDRLAEAERILSGLSDAELASADAVTLLEDVRLALAVPPEEPPPEPTLLELAVQAREADDFVLADSLFRAAIAEESTSVEIRQAYADFLQYEMEDLEGALEALREVERLTGGADPALQHRMALLEIWTDRPDDARTRLEALLGLLDVREARGDVEEGADPEATPPVTRADVLALLGDLERWGGHRLAAVERYESALAADPEHAAARAGLDAVRAEVDRQILETEEPRVGGLASALADTDEYVRADVGGEWLGVRGDWAWSTRAGNRWVEGFDVTGQLADGQGLFAELGGARWWRWGTVRTGARLGVQTVREDQTDVSVGGSVRLVGAAGRRTELRWDYQPAYESTNTLQSLQAEVRENGLTLEHARPLGERWSAALTAQAASLDHGDVSGAERNWRLSAGASAGRGVASGLVLGVAARALRYMDQAPDATGVRLYWDPELSLSLGPWAQYTLPLGVDWELMGRLSPAAAWIDERDAAPGGELVPDLSARLGLAHDGAQYRGSLELFYGQGRFRGYRSYGATLTFGIR